MAKAVNLIRTASVLDLLTDRLCAEKTGDEGAAEMLLDLMEGIKASLDAGDVSGVRWMIESYTEGEM